MAGILGLSVYALGAEKIMPTRRRRFGKKNVIFLKLFFALQIVFKGIYDDLDMCLVFLISSASRFPREEPG